MIFYKNNYIESLNDFLLVLINGALLLYIFLFNTLEQTVYNREDGDQHSTTDRVEPSHTLVNNKLTSSRLILFVFH